MLYHPDETGAVRLLSDRVWPRSRGIVRQKIRRPRREPRVAYLLTIATGKDVSDTVVCVVLTAEYIAEILQTSWELRNLKARGVNVDTLVTQDDNCDVYEYRTDLFFEEGEEYSVWCERPMVEDRDILHGYTYRSVDEKQVSWRLSEKYSGADMWSNWVKLQELTAALGSIQSGHIEWRKP